MSRTVLITGSAGFIGAHLVEHLLKNSDWNVVGIDSFKHRGDSERTRHLDPSRYRIICHDLNAPISPRTAGLIGHVDYIVNMASESHVDRSLTDPVGFIQNNVNLVLNTLEYARFSGCKKFIQISTDEVYGPAPMAIRHKEWSPILPSNPYAASKAAQEAIAISYWRSFGVPLIITNTMNNIGERQDIEKFIPMLISKISKEEPVIIHGAEDYIGSRFYLHARNHADAILFLLGNSTVTPYFDLKDHVATPDRFNVVGEVEINNLDLAKMVAKIVGKPLKFQLVDFHSARPGHDRRYALDGKAIADLGWKAPIEFEKSLEKTVKWTLEHPEWMK